MALSSSEPVGDQPVSDVNVVTAAVHANTLESPKDAKKKTGLSKTRRMQEAFAAHLRHVGRMYPAEKHPRVVLLIDNAPWHRGEADRRGDGGEPAPGVQAAAQLQPAAQPDRAVLEEAAAAGDPQPAVRHAGRPEGVAPGQPVLLPDRPPQGQKHHRGAAQAEGHQMRQHRRVHV